MGLLLLLLRDDHWVALDACDYFFNSSEVHSLFIDYEHLNHYLIDESRGTYCSWSNFGMGEPESLIYASKAFYLNSLTDITDITINVPAEHVAELEIFQTVCFQIADEQLCHRVQSVHLSIVWIGDECKSGHRLHTIAEAMLPPVNRDITSFTLRYQCSISTCGEPALEDRIELELDSVSYQRKFSA